MVSSSHLKKFKVLVSYNCILESHVLDFTWACREKCLTCRLTLECNSCQILCLNCEFYVRSQLCFCHMNYMFLDREFCDNMNSMVQQIYEATVNFICIKILWYFICIFLFQSLFWAPCLEYCEKTGRKAQSWQPTLCTSSSVSPASPNSTPSLSITRSVPCACRWWKMRWRGMTSGLLNWRKRKTISFYRVRHL